MPPNVITPQEPPANDQPDSDPKPLTVNPPDTNSYTNPVSVADTKPPVEIAANDNTSPMPGIDQTVSTPSMPSSMPTTPEMPPMPPSSSPTSPLSFNPPVLPETPSTAFNSVRDTTMNPVQPVTTPEMPPLTPDNNITGTPMNTPSAVTPINTGNPSKRPSLKLILILALLAVLIAGVLIWLVLN